MTDAMSFHPVVPQVMVARSDPAAMNLAPGGVRAELFAQLAAAFGLGSARGAPEAAATDAAIPILPETAGGNELPSGFPPFVMLAQIDADTADRGANAAMADALNGAVSPMAAALPVVPVAAAAPGSTAAHDARGARARAAGVAPGAQPDLQRLAAGLLAGMDTVQETPAVAAGSPEPLLAAEVDDLPSVTGAGTDARHAPSTPVLPHGAAPAPVTGADPAHANLDVRLPVQDPAFADGLSRQVVILVKDGIHDARLSVNPPELGPIEVRITVNNDQASVQLASHHAGARTAIEDALPRLREMFAQSGLLLGEAGVFAELPQNRDAQHANRDGAVQRGREFLDFAGGDDPHTDRIGATVALGLIDAYV